MSAAAESFDEPTSREVDVADVTLDPRPAVAPRGATVDGRDVVPPPAAGQITRPGALQYSDLHCPLLVDDEDKIDVTVVEQLANAEGEPSGRVVHRRPHQLVVDPVECPTCHIVVERHMLVASPLTGTRDCAIAVQARGNPAYTRLFGAMAGNAADADAEAVRHGKFGERVRRVLGPRGADEMPALGAGLETRLPPEQIRGMNLTAEAAAEHDRLDEARGTRAADSAGAFHQPTETVAPGPRAAAAAQGDQGPTTAVDAATDHPVPRETQIPRQADPVPQSLEGREALVRQRLDAETDPAAKAALADELQAIQDHRREQGA